MLLAGAVVLALITANVIVAMNRPPKDDAASRGAVVAPSPSDVQTTDTQQASPTRIPPPRLGVYLGTDRSAVEKYEKWLGRKVQDVVDFPARESWSDIADPSSVLNEWAGSNRRLVLAVAMLPENEGDANVQGMKAGGRGEFNQYFRQLAQRLVAGGQSHAVLRIGWEFNIKTWPWGVSDHKAFIAFFRQIVKTVRAVKGADFDINWNVNNGYNPYDAADYWPGDDYVDSVGVDAYDLDGTVYRTKIYRSAKCAEECKQVIQQKAWDQVIFGGPHGLGFWSLFAAEHKKPLSLPEWGLWNRIDGTGGADDPFFVAEMHHFITQRRNNVEFAAHFNLNSFQGQHNVPGSFPVAGKDFRKLFGPQGPGLEVRTKG